MDEYLQCLYNYILDHLHCDARLDLFEFTRCTAQQDAAWNALKKALTPEQLHLVEDYRSAWNGFHAAEEKLLFQSAVSLGKWMARP